MQHATHTCKSTSDFWPSWSRQVFWMTYIKARMPVISRSHDSGNQLRRELDYWIWRILSKNYGITCLIIYFVKLFHVTFSFSILWLPCPYLHFHYHCLHRCHFHLLHLHLLILHHHYKGKSKTITFNKTQVFKWFADANIYLVISCLCLELLATNRARPTEVDNDTV